MGALVLVQASGTATPKEQEASPLVYATQEPTQTPREGSTAADPATSPSLSAPGPAHTHLSSMIRHML